MSPLQIIAVGVRLFAIWLFLYATSNIAGSYFAAVRYSVRDTPLPLVLALGAVIVVCVLLWIFPNAVARKILPLTPAHQNRTSLLEDWFSVGCSLIGVWALAKAIPALASYLLVHYMGYKIYPDSFSVNPDWPLHVAFNVLQLLFGTWLFLGARGLKKVLEWVRQS